MRMLVRGLTATLGVEQGDTAEDGDAPSRGTLDVCRIL